MSSVIYASNFGVSTQNDGVKNRELLQSMLDIGGEVIIDIVGDILVDGCLYIGSNTTLRCLAGSCFKKTDMEGKKLPILMNKGAVTKIYDENIQIYGMRLKVNGVEARRSDILGINGHISLFYIKHSIISDFQCMDLAKSAFCIQICTFEDSLIENVHIEGMKDAVHYGPGKRFILRNGVFRTFDDPIALNANDYAVANPEMGWIEDGLIEFCYDLNQPETTGYFCRLLGGAWKDWSKGMIIRNSDTVVSNGRMYRCSMPADGKEYISNTAPSHENGAKIIDGINWVMTQDKNVVYNCGCRRIHFKDIFLQKRRPIAFAFHFDNDNYSHSYYPYADAPIQTDIVFENIYMDEQVDYLIRSTTPVGSIKVLNSNLKNTAIRMANRGVPGIEYGETDVSLVGNTILGELKISSVEGRNMNLSMIGNILHDDTKIIKDGSITEY